MIGAAKGAYWGLNSVKNTVSKMISGMQGELLRTTGKKFSLLDIINGKAKAEVIKVQAKTDWLYKKKIYEIDKMEKELWQQTELDNRTVSRILGKPHYENIEPLGPTYIQSRIGPVANDNSRLRLINNTEKTVVGKVEDNINKAPYNPRKMEELIKQRKPGEKITSSTLLEANAPNMKLADKRHPVSRVVFDQRGFPNFDKHIVYEMRLPKNIYKIEKSKTHMKAATIELRKQIEAGKVDKNIFTDKQLDQIMKGKPRIDKLTWHHHQETGRMQLIPRDIHQQTGHIGGMDLWYKE